MEATERKPIDTSEVVLFELRPSGEWAAVASAGPARITAGVRVLDRVEVASIRKIDDGEQRAARIADLAVKSVQRGAHILDTMALPFSPYIALVNLVFELSTTGADPFSVAPAESPA